MASFANRTPFPSELPTAPLITLSYAKFQAHNGEEHGRFLDALKGPGFVYLCLDDSPEGIRLLKTVEEMFELPKKLFAIPHEEKMQYVQDYSNDHPWTGFQNQGRGVVDEKGNRDWSQFMNIGKTELLDTSKPMPLPDLLNENRNLLRSFAERSHAVLVDLLSSLTSALDLPEGTLPSRHRFLDHGTDQLRLTYAKISSDPSQTRTAEIALPGHRDASTMTILFNREAGLQILPPEEASKPAREQQWQYLPPLPGHAIVNIGDAMVIYTNGLLRSTPHRVLAPPGAPPGTERYSVVYFMRPGDEQVLKRLEGSDLIPPLKEGEVEEYVTGKKWVTDRFLAILANKGIIKDDKHR